MAHNASLGLLFGSRREHGFKESCTVFLWNTTTMRRETPGRLFLASWIRRLFSGVILTLFRMAAGWTAVWGFLPASKCCAVSSMISKASRRSRFALSIGPTRREHASDGVSSALRRLPERIPLRPTVGVPIAMAFAWEDALRRCRVDMEQIGKATLEQRNAAAYLELHIEQGPVLEAMHLPLGVVLGTKGVERHAITFHGQEAHSGSTPMKVRRDALAAAAKLALEIRSIAGRYPDAVATMGSVKTFPGIVTAVVGRCETTLDMRDLDAGILASMLAEAREASERFAKEEGCTADWSKIWSIEPVPFDPRLIALCNEAVQETAATSHSLPSGPLHDAAEVSRAGIPTAMMFVQSLNGLSHNKAEDTKVADLTLAVQAFDKLAKKTLSLLNS